MKKAELLFAAIIAIGFIFKLMHWPYSNEILTIGALLLAIFYFYLSFALLNAIGFRAALKKASYKNISKLRLFGAFSTGFAFSIIIINSLFKLMFWPYGHYNLGIGLLFLAILLFLILVFYFKNRKQFIKANYLRFIIIGGLGLIIYSVSNNQIVDLYYGSDPEYAEEYKMYLKDESKDAKRPSRAFKSR